MTEHVATSTLAMFREGLLDAGESARISAHVAGCARCARAGAHLDRVTDLLASRAAPPMPPGVSARIEAALAAEASARAAGEVPGAAPSRAGAGPGLTGPAESWPDGEQAPAGETPLAATGRHGQDSQDSQDGTRAGQHPAAAASGPAALPRPSASPVPSRPSAPAGPKGPAGTRPPRHAIRRLARSRARLQLIAAAAAIVVLGGGGYAVAQFAGGGGAITASTASGSPARSGPAAGPPRHAVGPPGQLRPAIGPEPSSPAAQRPIGAVSSNTNYTRAHLARQVHATLAKYPPGSAQRPAGHRNRTLAHAVTGCVHGITGSRRPRLVDIAHYQGRPAMIIVVTASGTATGHVWVVARDCSATRPHLLTQALLP